MRYLTIDEVSQINALIVGPDALADFGLLESAVMRPQQSLLGGDAYPGIHEKAGALLHSLARNHPFLDGNKRTALLATVLFYAKNGWALDMGQGEIVAVVMDAAEGQIDARTIAGELKGQAFPLDLPTE